MFNRNGTKYNATTEIVNGHKFRSKLEARIYRHLLDNNIEVLEFEPLYILLDAFSYNWKHIRAVSYKADFLIGLKGLKIILEVKGFETPVWKIKKKLMIHKMYKHNREELFIVCKSIKDLDEQLKEIYKKV